MMDESGLYLGRASQSRSCLQPWQVCLGLAIEEVIVPGGGAASVHLSTLVPAIKDKLDDGDERLGADIIQKTLVAPASLIAQNAGIEGEVVVKKATEWEMGYNAMTDKYENFVESGVIDPAKVTRCALQNSVSVAGMVLTTQAIVVEICYYALYFDETFEYK